MGKYDDILAGLPAPTQASAPSAAPIVSGKYDDILSGLTPAPMSPWGAAQALMDSRPELKPYANDGKTLESPTGFADTVKKATGAAIETVGAPIRVGATINEGRKGFPAVAGEGAEKLGEMGVSPEVSAALMLPVAMAPELVAAGQSFKGLYGNSKLAQGIRNTPRDLSPRYDVLNEKAGISKNLPETGGRTARFPNLAGQPVSSPPPFAPAIAPKLYPKDPNALVNFARSRIEALGERLSPQELNDYDTLIGQMMDKGKFGSGGPLAIASKVKSSANQLLNKAIPGKADLDQIYKISKTLRLAPEVAKKVWDYFGPKLRYGAGVIGVP